MNYPVCTAVMLAGFILILLFLFPSLSFGQTGDLWFGWPGSIEIKVPSDSTFFIATDELPDHADHLYECRFEWWSQTPSGQVRKVLAYQDCESRTPLQFEWTEEMPDTLYLRKYVYWQTVHGGRWATTQRKIIAR